MKIEIKTVTMEQAENDGITAWPIWTCGVSEFDWEYSDRESCYLLEGQVEVKTEWETVKFGEGDFVVFPQRLKCVWKVNTPVKKHYKFG